MNHDRRWLAAAILAIATSPPPRATGQESEPSPRLVEAPPPGVRLSYAREISELIAGKCLGCHNAADAKGKLSLEDVAGMLSGGTRGPALVVGKSSESRLFLFAAHRDKPTMPPVDAKLEPLTPLELGLLERWIDQGAVDDSVDDIGSATDALAPDLPARIRPIVAVDLTDDGRRVAFGWGNRVRVHDADSGRLEIELGGHRDIVQSVRFSPDGRMLAAGSHKFVTLWRCPDVDNLNMPSRHAGGTPTTISLVDGDWTQLASLGPHVDRVLSLDFNSDATLLAAGSGEASRSGHVTLWETGKGLHVRAWDGVHSDAVYGLRFSPDGTMLATASADKLVKILDVATGRERATLEGHTHHALGVDWSGDGRQLVSCGAEGALKFWDPRAGEALRSSEPADGALNAVRWSRGPGAATIATASTNREARLWNPRNMNVTRRFQGAEGVLFCVALAADRTKIAAGGSEGVLYLWNPANARLLRRIVSALETTGQQSD